MTSIADLLGKASASQVLPAQAQVSARSAGSTAMILSDISTWATDTPVFFTTYTPDENGLPIEGTRQDWKGLVNPANNSIVDLVLTSSSTDIGNTENDIAVLNPTAAWANSLITCLLNLMTPQGTLKPSTVGKLALQSGAAQDITDVNGNIWVIRYGTDTTPVAGKYVLLISPTEG